MKSRLENIESRLVSQVEAQMAHLDSIDAAELDKVINSIHHLEEAIYYSSITKAMEEAEKKEKYKHTEYHHYTPIQYYRDMDRQEYDKMYYPMREYDQEMMYYSGQPRDSMGRYIGRRQYSEMEMPMDLRDEREGRSPMSRRMYMESKELHKDKATKIKDLEKYMKELGEDVIEMIEGASPEERQLLEKKIASLATKVGSLTANG